MFRRRQAVLGILVCACAIHAQQPAVVLRTETRAVEINVVAKDKNGDPIRGLRQEDFSVFDNGKRREVQFFSADAPPPSRGAQPAPSPRLTAIVLDGLNTEFEDQGYVRDQALKALSRLPLDEPVGILSLTRGLELENFTRHREKLLAAIHNFRPNIPPYAMKKRIQVTLAALRLLAQRMSGVAGRKSIVWITGAFMQVRSYQPAIESTLDQINEANVSLYPIDARGLTLGGAFMNIQTIQQFADSTGGEAFYNGNNISGAIEQAVEDSKLTYVLGFYLTDKDRDNRFHELKVQVNRPGAVLHYRRGYSAAPM